MIRVRITRARGSTPRETGATMIVTADSTQGTIGGGQLEYMAIDRARQMLTRAEDSASMDIPLGPEIGQCCGGRVELSLTRISAAPPAPDHPVIDTPSAAQNATGVGLPQPPGPAGSGL